MISASRKMNKIFKSLYLYEDKYIKQFQLLKNIMESNNTRLKYLESLLERSMNNELNPECEKILLKNIEFITNFMNGNIYTEFSISEKYYQDKEKCLIIPTERDLEYLFSLIKSNKEMYDFLYKDKTFKIELPKDTFNQKMVRELEVHNHNIAHLLGLTDSEREPDPNKNQLKKYFLQTVENVNDYGDTIAEALLNWILSEEGQKNIIELNKKIERFIILDKLNNPNNYDSNGYIKAKSLEKFKERFKEKFGFNYPIIKFSRYINKCINTFNFFNMTNINQVILDYNAPEGKKDEKDIFIVNCPLERMMEDMKEYQEFKNNVFELLEQYALNNSEENKRKLDEIGINVNDKEIASYLNIIKTRKYIKDKDIQLNLTVLHNKITELINEYFYSNIHLIGFDTVFEEQDIPVDKKSINKAHCDTSIAIKIGELVDEFYKRGRAFFLDKVLDNTGRGIIRLSNPKEEMIYLRMYDKQKAEELHNNLHEFNKKAYNYININYERLQMLAREKNEETIETKNRFKN